MSDKKSTKASVNLEEQLPAAIKKSKLPELITIHVTKLVGEWDIENGSEKFKSFQTLEMLTGKVLVTKYTTRVVRKLKINAEVSVDSEGTKEASLPKVITINKKAIELLEYIAYDYIEAAWNFVTSCPTYSNVRTAFHERVNGEKSLNAAIVNSESVSQFFNLGDCITYLPDKTKASIVDVIMQAYQAAHGNTVDGLRTLLASFVNFLRLIAKFLSEKVITHSDHVKSLSITEKDLLQCILIYGHHVTIDRVAIADLQSFADELATVVAAKGKGKNKTNANDRMAASIIEELLGEKKPTPRSRRAATKGKGVDQYAQQKGSIVSAEISDIDLQKLIDGGSSSTETSDDMASVDDVVNGILGGKANIFDGLDGDLS